MHGLLTNDGQGLFDQKTPFYLYDLELLERTLQAAAMAADKRGYKIHYALKANNEPEVVRQVVRYGMGADCVSGNELDAALRHGFDAEGIVFAGVGKTDEEILMAIQNGVLLNCESLEELMVTAGLSERAGKQARIALRINPDVDPCTHKKITTGLDENKFGIHPSQLQESLDFCRDHDALHFVGLHFHIGSQILTPEPFIRLCEKVNRLWEVYRIDEYGGEMLNLGGGLGIDYYHPEQHPVPDFESYFDIFSQHLRVPEHVHIHFEPGRSLVAQCGTLITRVLYVKSGHTRKMVITDAGMTELLRPALYQAFHKIDNLVSGRPEAQYDVMGPACESSDVFAKDILLPGTCRGDILAVRSCGAYAQSMSLQYNLREKARSYFFRPLLSANNGTFSDATEPFACEVVD